MSSFRDLIIQANADTREKFVYWCRFGRNPGHILDDSPGLISDPPAPLKSRAPSWSDNPALDDDLRLRHLAKDAAFGLNKPYNSHKRYIYEDQCLAKLQSLVEAQDRPASFEEWQVLRYRPPVKFREFDGLFQQALPYVRKEFVTWCIEAWAKPSVVEMLHRAALPEAQALEDETDWREMQRLGQDLQQQQSPWIWWSLDIQLVQRRASFWNADRTGWRVYHTRQCAYWRLVAFNDALHWYHNILIDHEGFRVRNLAFCATKAALTSIPNIDRPSSDDPDVFIWAMTVKLRTLLESQS